MRSAVACDRHAFYREPAAEGCLDIWGYRRFIGKDVAYTKLPSAVALRN